MQIILLGANADNYQVSAPNVASDGSLVVDAAHGVLFNDNGVGLHVAPLLNQATVKGGIVILNADGSFKYTAKAGFSGLDSFNYTATDATGHVATAMVNIKIIPDAHNDIASVVKQQMYHGASVLANDIGTGLTVISYTSAGHGSLVVNADDTYTYQANKGFIGVDSFTYTAQDANGQTITSIVSIVVKENASDKDQLFASSVAQLLAAFGC